MWAGASVRPLKIFRSLPSDPLSLIPLAYLQCSGLVIGSPSGSIPHPYNTPRMVLPTPYLLAPFSNQSTSLVPSPVLGSPVGGVVVLYFAVHQGPKLLSYVLTWCLTPLHAQDPGQLRVPGLVHQFTRAVC